MRRASVPRLAAAAWIATLVLLARHRSLRGPRGTTWTSRNVLDALLFGAVMQGMATLGALIARREPRNPIGWIFCAVPVPGRRRDRGRAHTRRGRTTSHPARPARLPPTGSPAGHGWPGSPPTRSWFRCSSRTAGLRGRDGGTSSGADLVAIGWIAVLAGVTDSPPQPVVVATGALVAVLIAAGLASAVVRYRRAGATQRVQIRECVFAAWAAFVGFFAISVLAPYEALYAARLRAPAAVGRPGDAPLPALRRRRDHPADAGLRVSRGRAGWRLPGRGDAGRRACCRNLTGSSGTVAVTVSTLAVVGAFQPMRRRIQAGVDRRFYRSGYDAQAAMDAFSGRLRDEIDLDALRNELLDAVAQGGAPGSHHPLAADARRSANNRRRGGHGDGRRVAPLTLPLCVVIAVASAVLLALGPARPLRPTCSPASAAPRSSCSR